jgi:Zn-dependent protease with chaperone function
MTKNYGMPITVIAGMMIVGVSCERAVLFLSRKTAPSLVSSSEMLATSNQEYGDFLKANKVVSAGDSRTAMVKRVGRNIQSSVEQYFRQNNLSLSGYSWEFNLVDDKEANAWCMPGGRVVVYTGMLPFTKNDGGLAVDGHDCPCSRRTW